MTEAISTKRQIEFPDRSPLSLERPLVMGVLNVTPDSFSDGGKFADTNTAVEHALEMIDDGADIIDIGGQSTRPGSDQVSVNDELSRVIPVIERIRKKSDIPISIDTSKAEVARAAIDVGANMVNDISALRSDSEMIDVVRESSTPVVLMHMLGTPKTMQKNPSYNHCVREIKEFFAERIQFCVDNGIERDKIILDPGIGFGKRLQDNIGIIAHLDEFREFGLPVLLGASRKSFINMITKTEHHASTRIGGSLAAALLAASRGVDILRVHDVYATVEALQVARTIETAGQ